MLSSLRGVIYSKVGMVVTFGILIVIALAFAAGDVTGLSNAAGGLLGHPLASVDGEKVTADDIRRRAQDELRAARQQRPELDMAAFVAAGGVESLVTRSLTGLALETFGEEQGMRVSRALVGSELKAIPAFAGATGQFDQQAYLRLIAQRGMTDAQVQREIARETMAQFLLVPTTGATQVPQQLALRYASLLLEKRAGEAALIPATPTGPAPTDAEVQDWYKRNVARYTTPERRVIRYALVTPQQFAAQAAPGEADIQKAYDADKAKYAPKPLRDVTLVTVLDQKAAQALAAKVRAGTPIAAAARAAGLEARTVAAAEQSSLATQTAPAVAAALFAAPQGTVVGPVAASIGFVVGRVDKVTQDPGKTLAQARPEIVAALTKARAAEAIGKVRDAVEDALADNANIAEVARDQKLTVQATPALLATGVNPDQPQGQPDPALAPIVAAGFAAEDGDTPVTVPLGEDGGFAIAALDRIVPATPLPLAQARAAVVADLTADRARRAAQAAANAVVAKVNAGTPLAAALAQAGVKARAERVESTRAQITANQGQVNPVLAMMFGMKQGTARAIQAPDGRGWLVLRVDQVVPGDASRQPAAIQATRLDLGRAIGGEYAQQFANAVAAAQGAKRYPDAVAQLKKDLVGGDAGQ